MADAVDPALRECFSQDIGMALGDADKGLSCPRRRAAPLLPFLERAFGDMKRRGKLGLRHASALPGLDHFIDCDLSDSGKLSCLHLAHRLK